MTTTAKPSPRNKVREAREPGVNQWLLTFFHLALGISDFLIFIVIPLITSITINLHNWPLYGDPKSVGAENYAQLLSGEDPAFYTVLDNTLMFTIGYTAMSLVVSTGIAVWLHSLPDWAPFFRVLFFIPVITPMVANTLIWRVMLDDQDVISGILTAIGITSPSWLGHPTWAVVSLIMMSLWQAVGYSIVVLATGLNNTNPAIMETSKIDGTTTWSRFWRVASPMFSPSLFFASVMTVIRVFKVFTQSFMFTKGGPGESTNTLMLYLYHSAFSRDKLGLASSLTQVLFMLVMLVTTLQFVGQKKRVNYGS